ncbi:metallo-beta-lactamase class B [Reichenbachiella faecimaris]|uniref:beta-lactamase n=1 Tax=Reichenbachiella faecimaris TaxID=692418 RepID=A0A1W2GD77_REIFA|nr:subclass B1 metallo-beta-lactamase [Reichenbachiella faecimaris]SMD34620.1 metallo-beta-lactamase class B [Reichenbachiella faecimaris]
MHRYFFFLLFIIACDSKGLYESETLIIKQVSDHAYQHISYLQTDDYGKVACNGMIVIDQNEAIIFDTPAENEVSSELIEWVEKTLDSKVVAIVPTHFHGDCLGGLTAFHERQIPSIAHHRTIQLLDSIAVIPWQGFDDFINLTVGQQEVIVDFVGEGHTPDNVVAYFPSEQIMFGGCLIKSMKAGRGYLGDANLEEWSGTVEKIKSKYPDTKTVIPGHGDAGGTELLDKTIEMFSSKSP